MVASNLFLYPVVCCAQRWISGHSYPQLNHHYCICEAAPATEEKYILDHPFGHSWFVGRSRIRTDADTLLVCWCYGKSWDITFSRISLAIRTFFPFTSLVNLAFISFERVHATYRPFKHRLIKKWVYGLVIAFIYLSAICKSTIEAVTNWPFSFIWVISSYSVLLVLMCICYISIYIKVRCSRQHQLNGAAGLRERKLTRTLFLVTIASLLTFLPGVIVNIMIFFHIMSFSNWSTPLTITGTIITLFFANSLINPILYAVRMPEFRAGISKMVFCRTPQDHRNPVEYPLRDL